MVAPRRLCLAVAAALVLASALGCSFSYSSESISDSSKGSSDSSGSSSGEKDAAAFRDDVTTYTAAWVAAGGRAVEGFFGGLGELARKRGVSDWEGEPATWEAIGRGLGRSDLSEAERIAYAHAWTGGDAAKTDALDRGLAAAQ
jgi:hypothetical protein